MKWACREMMQCSSGDVPHAILWTMKHTSEKLSRKVTFTTYGLLWHASSISIKGHVHLRFIQNCINSQTHTHTHTRTHTHTHTHTHKYNRYKSAVHSGHFSTFKKKYYSLPFILPSCLSLFLFLSVSSSLPPLHDINKCVIARTCGKMTSMKYIKQTF